jgi:surface polysaccharide O-acyltransferase-like enzyme
MIPNLNMSDRKQSSFLGYLHSFRGFAIINIVFIHAFAYALFDFNGQRFDQKSPFYIANEVFFHNSTIYFALISGILFSVVLKSKGYKRFYSSKLKNVLLPYLFLTLLFSIFNPVFNPPVYIPFALQPDFFSYLKAAFNNFIFGTAQFPYWYIPVLIFLYLVTPLLDYVMNIKRWGTLLMCVIIALPLAISRVELFDMQKNHLSLSTMIYFTGAYAAGIYFGTDPEKRFSWVKKNLLVFVMIALLSSAALVYCEVMELNKFGPWSLMSTLYYIQKMSLSGVFIVVFKNLGERQPRWLNPIAHYAFVIYFLHAFFLDLLVEPLLHVINLHEIAPLNLFLAALLYLILAFALSMLVGWIFKRLFGKSSKMLVGV